MTEYSWFVFYIGTTAAGIPLNDVKFGMLCENHITIVRWQNGGIVMTKKEIISLSLKLAGIYCIIPAISYLAFATVSVVSIFRKESLWHILTSMTSFVSLLVSFTPSVLLLLFAAYLIFSRKLPSNGI